MGAPRSTITALQQRVQRLQLDNLALKSEFIGAQRALPGYQATGENRFLDSGGLTAAPASGPPGRVVPRRGPPRARHHPGTQPVFSGTTSTGSGDLCTTSCATLPSSIDVRSERPRVPTTSSPAW